MSLFPSQVEIPAAKLFTAKGLHTLYTTQKLIHSNIFRLVIGFYKCTKNRTRNSWGLIYDSALLDKDYMRIS